MILVSPQTKVQVDGRTILHGLGPKLLELFLYVENTEFKRSFKDTYFKKRFVYIRFCI